MGLNAWRKAKDEISWKKNTGDLLQLVYDSVNSKKLPEIAVLEICHALGNPLAGGDKLMEPMAIRLKDKFEFSIVVSSIGAKHWENAPLNKNLVILPRNRFDKAGSPVPLFLAYCARMYEATRILITKFNKSDYLYSSTNILPDILPAFIAKFLFPKLTWIARIHHLIPPPNKRPGRFTVNLVSYTMQSFAIRMISQKADIIIALNENLRKELIKRNFSKDKLKVLGAGIEYNKISSKKVLSKTPHYDGVFLGRLHFSKGISDLVPIWKEVVKKIPGARLAVIGHGEKAIRNNLKEQINYANMGKNIKVLGYLSDDSTYRIMKNAKVFLFTDHEAGWGIAVAEAMACGLPVVGYDIGVLGSVYRNGFIKIKLADYVGFGKAIIEVIAKNSLQKRLASEAYRQASGLDWKFTAERFHRFTKYWA